MTTVRPDALRLVSQQVAGSVQRRRLPGRRAAGQQVAFETGRPHVPATARTAVRRVPRPHRSGGPRSMPSRSGWSRRSVAHSRRRSSRVSWSTRSRRSAAELITSTVDVAAPVVRRYRLVLGELGRGAKSLLLAEAVAAGAVGETGRAPVPSSPSGAAWRGRRPRDNRPDRPSCTGPVEADLVRPGDRHTLVIEPLPHVRPGRPACRRADPGSADDAAGHHGSTR